MAREDYVDQVNLLVRILPYVANEKIFALKGGTAINLFYRDLPRLSVDIDLTYLPIKDRDESLAEISDALERIAKAIDAGIPNAKVRSKDSGKNPTRMQVSLDTVTIKIETSPVMRGLVHNPKVMNVNEAVEEAFGSAEIQVASFEDLYGGKLCAAIDRQHPRDLYDVKLLYENEGMTDRLFRTFLVYVASARRPPHELLNPNLIDLDQPYARDFEGMTTTPVPLADLITTRERLIADLQARLVTNVQAFLRGLYEGVPDFSLIGTPRAIELPAVHWKLQNIEILKTENPSKYQEQHRMLEALFR
ncbi:MAG: nucleotidyl transferase AbiEii/AbiGii toxin family protein [Gammaproteobacteria bacterium]|nr:nucleotidyl transferase AbiEii/AbiGii toxin family protein [Gammaproteobacteria bacterium]